MSTPHTPTKAKPSASLPQPSAQLYNSTPVKKSLQGSEHYASLSKPDAELLKKNMAGELAGQWVGPMPVKDFISTFFSNKCAKPKFKPKFFDVLAKQNHESAMYDPFINHITTEAPAAIEGFKLINTSQYEDHDIAIPGMKNKPDVSCYKKTCRVTAERPTRYEDIQLIFEFKPWREEADPFEDRPGKAEKGNRFPFEAQAEIRRQCRGQIACYARVWCARQHRTHCFIVWIADPHARIIRFDRSGAIVSEKFDYRKNGDILLNFLWSFSHSDDAARGLDGTVTKASPTDAKTARKALSNWAPTSNRSVFKVQVPDPDPDGDKKRTRPFFVWAPLEDPRSVTGRATRGYPAWDPKGNGGKGRVVFLKDSWRSCEPGMEKEVDILAELKKQECRNVPELVCGDDLDGQTTITKKHASEPWNIGAKADKFVQRAHTRFVEKNVGSHLTSATQMENGMHSRRFLQIIFDAFIGHYDAYVRCGILHRDVSAGNILVDEKGRGFLNDWDLSKHIENTAARQVFRSGTWQFMSADLLKHPKKLNTLQDDLESYFWLVTFHILRYMKHNKLENLEETMRSIFDSQAPTPPGEEAQGGIAKYSLIMDSHPLTGKFEVIGNKALTVFYHKALSHLRGWYGHIFNHNQVVTDYALDNDISVEDASIKVPVKTDSLAMHTHQGMMKLFTEALAAEHWWPTPAADRFRDRLADSQSEESEEQNQGAAREDGVKGKGAPSGTGPSKNTKQNDDAGPAMQAFAPRLTRQQTRLMGMGSGSGSHQP